MFKAHPGIVCEILDLAARHTDVGLSPPWCFEDVPLKSDPSIPTDLCCLMVGDEVKVAIINIERRMLV